MDYKEFKESIRLPGPPPTLTVYQQALWYDANGNWNKSHELIQDLDDPYAAWIHAYLHRKDGDHSNASYWYARAGKPAVSCSPSDEWEQLATHFANP